MTNELVTPKKYEEHAYVLDFMPHGKSILIKGRDGSIIQAIGKEWLTLLEVLALNNTSFEIGESICIAKEGRTKVISVLGRIRYEDLTNDAKNDVLGFPYETCSSTPSMWTSDGEILYHTFRVTLQNMGANYVYDTYIKIMDSNGQNQRTICHVNSTSPDYTKILYPIISPDGSKIVYQKCWSPGYSELRIMRSDGTGDMKLTETSDYGVYYQPEAFSQDGEKIYFSHNGSGVYQIYVINFDGTGEQKFIDDQAHHYGGSKLAPDGARLSFAKYVNGNYELWQIHLYSNEISKISDNSMGYGWKPNGEIFYARKHLEAWSPFIPDMGALSVLLPGSGVLSSK